MTIPKFRDMPGPTDLQKVDWTDTKTAVATLKTLETDLKYNTKCRGDFLTSALQEAEDLVKQLELVGAELKGMSKRGGVKLPDLGQLKAKRTRVKELMAGSGQCEKDFFSAMADFRGSGKFGLPDKIEKAVSTLRGSTQGADKAFAGIPGALVALEARASAALKTANALLSAYGDDQMTVEKIDAAFDKLSEMSNKAETCGQRISSSIKFIVKNMGSKDSKIIGLCKVKASEVGKEAANMLNFQVAVKAGTVAIKTMVDSISDDGIRMKDGRPKFEQANQKLQALLKSLGEANTEVTALVKDKKLPELLKKELPAGVK